MANAIVVVAKVDKNNRYNIQQLMDLVSGVENYSIGHTTKQGIIKKFYNKELNKLNRENPIMSMQDAVSVFWESVFKYLSRAQTTGEEVQVRIVTGQNTSTQSNTATRKTKCNPIHYLRNMGIMGIRNVVNKSYRRNLIQICEDCSTISSVTSTEVAESKICPECKSSTSKKIWPSGSSTYKSKKSRVCEPCGTIWTRQFSKSCYNCKSVNVKIESRLIRENEIVNNVVDDNTNADALSIQEGEIEYNEIVSNIRKFLPSDPNNPGGTSRTKEIYDMITNSSKGEDICKKCVISAHGNKKLSCGATSFNINKCINFNKKIGEYHNCSASLSARRIKKIRQYVSKYIMEHKNINDTHEAMYILLKKVGCL